MISNAIDIGSIISTPLLSLSKEGFAYFAFAHVKKLGSPWLGQREPSDPVLTRRQRGV
jgi:hypothetical protein